MTVDTLIVNAFEQWLAGEVEPALVRQIESGASARPLWESLTDSGFADLLLPETAGGAEGNLPTLFHIVMACGASALPLPLPTTLWVRAALARNGLVLPDGPIALGHGQREGSRIVCIDVPFAATAQWVLVVMDEEAILLPMADAEIQTRDVYASLRRDLAWSNDTQMAVQVPLDEDWQTVGAVLSAALIVGASTRVLDMTLEYANSRTQFGKLIGKFQVNQQQISVMAEEVFSARMAADLALRGTGSPSRLLTSVAKARTSEAVTPIVSIAHAIFGAIGITEECDLQLFTRRLHEWRGDFGCAAMWQLEVGKALIQGNSDLRSFVLETTPNN